MDAAVADSDCLRPRSNRKGSGFNAAAPAAAARCCTSSEGAIAAAATAANNQIAYLRRAAETR